MRNAQLGGGFLKQGKDIPFAVGKTVCEFKAATDLDAFRINLFVEVPLHQSFQKAVKRKASEHSKALFQVIPERGLYQQCSQFSANVRRIQGKGCRKDVSFGLCERALVPTLCTSHTEG